MKLKIQYKPIADLIPYARNSRTHSDAQIVQIAASIKEFGWTNPVLLDGENGIIAGHGRVMAAHKLGETEVPTIELSHMDENQKRAYIIADNKLALNADWDNEMLALEINDLKDAGYDFGLIGFSLDEIEELNPEEKENTYTQKVDIPTYEPSAEKPNVKDLFDDENAFNLIKKIKSSKLPQAEKDFLMLTAGRHVRLNFQLIADYYAHSQREVQELMEDSALVIVDIDNAISNGWVNLSKKLDDIYDEDNEE
jgi:hypothetical protein